MVCAMCAGEGGVEVRGTKVVEESVGAVSSLNNELFVALNGSRQIHVYHADDLHFVRSLPVDHLGAQASQLRWQALHAGLGQRSP